MELTSYPSRSKDRSTRDQYYIFKNILAKNLLKIGVFDSIQSQTLKYFDHNIGI
jgi:hypothetical protein